MSVLSAGLWGVVAASSLFIGAVLGIYRQWDRRLIGLVLGFGAGALIAGVSFELVEEGMRVAGAFPVAIGLAAGRSPSLRSSLCSTDRRSFGRGLGRLASLAGRPLDGIPEQIVLGIGLAAGDGVSVALLVAIFVSDLPEAIGSPLAP